MHIAGASWKRETSEYHGIERTSEDGLRSPASLTIRGAGFCGRTVTMLTDVFSALSCDYDCTLAVMEDTGTLSWTRITSREFGKRAVWSLADLCGRSECYHQLIAFMMSSVVWDLFGCFTVFGAKNPDITGHDDHDPGPYRMSRVYLNKSQYCTTDLAHYWRLWLVLLYRVAFVNNLAWSVQDYLYLDLASF